MDTPCRIDIDEEGLVAQLSMDPPDEGESAPGEEELLEHLRQQESIAEPDPEALRQAVELLSAGETVEELVIARGRPPRPGRDGQIEWQGEFFERRPLERPDGSVDFYHCNRFSVEAGQRIARILPPDDGEAGLDVHGKTLEAEPGQPLELELDESVRHCPDDDQFLEAVSGGRVEHAGQRLRILDLYEVDAVDFSTASVEFHGAVEVKGDVREGFALVADGSVTVAGFVEGAKLDCGGSLTVGGGVVGLKKAVVRAAGDLELAFARELTLECGGQLLCHGELLWGRGTVGGDLTCQGGRLAGGEWTVGGSAYTRELGAPGETSTLLRVGTDPSRQAEIEALVERREEMAKEIEKREGQAEPLRRKKTPSEKERFALGKLEEYLARLVEQAAELHREELRLRRRLRTHQRAQWLWVSETVHPGVKIWAGGKGQPLEIRTPLRGPLKIGFEPGRRLPVVLAGDANARPAGAA